LAAKQILGYLLGITNFRIFYPKKNTMQISDFVDVDFVGYEESAKFTTRLVFRIGVASISWLSLKQSCIVLTSLEAK
jgi:hypothetical protein